MMIATQQQRAWTSAMAMYLTAAKKLEDKRIALPHCKDHSMFTYDCGPCIKAAVKR